MMCMDGVERALTGPDRINGPVVLAAIVALVVAQGCSPSASTLPVVVGVRSTVDTVYYEAEGRNGREWLVSMRTAARVAGVPAIRRWVMRTRGNGGGTSSRCSVTRKGMLCARCGNRPKSATR